MTSLLLLSNSSMPGGAPLEHVGQDLEEFLDGKRTVHFVPFALKDHDAYLLKMQAAFSVLGVTVIGLHKENDPAAAIAQAEVVFIGGGNSFRLLKQLERFKLLDPIRERVQAGELLYIGSSAGTNMACPTMRTTNDMPIVMPQSLNCLGLLPFQINPHYQDVNPANHMGETRETRIKQFLEENAVPVLGLREGTWLIREDSSLSLCGDRSARLFQPDEEPIEYSPGADLSFLLNTNPKFDTPSKT